jgi:prolipoprotein diacylglyceryltransferase
VNGLLAGGGLLGAFEVGLRPFWTLLDPPPLLLRWDALAASLTVMAAMALAAWLARRVDAFGALRPLRMDDLVYIVVGILPGAVVGGRLLHALAYLDTYAADPGALLDPGRGTLSLLGAVAGGTLTGIYVAHVLATPWRRWLDVAAPVLLFAIGGAKIAQFLGGGGQGTAFDGPWAVAFTGDGPWTSTFASVPAHPAQLYEAFWALAGLLVLSWFDAVDVALRLPRGFRQEGAWLAGRRARGDDVAVGRLRFGLLYLVALAWWLVGRFVVGFTWRDDAVVGPLRADQAMALVGLAVVAALFAVATRPGPAAPASDVPPVGGGSPGYEATPWGDDPDEEIDWPAAGARVDLPLPRGTTPQGTTTRDTTTQDTTTQGTTMQAPGNQPRRMQAKPMDDTSTRQGPR